MLPTTFKTVNEIRAEYGLGPIGKDFCPEFPGTSNLKQQNHWNNKTALTKTIGDSLTTDGTNQYPVEPITGGANFEGIQFPTGFPMEIIDILPAEGVEIVVLPKDLTERRKLVLKLLQDYEKMESKEVGKRKGRLIRRPPKEEN